jgi:small nuclear ribonucleoprotein (snRNP)-like protein
MTKILRSIPLALVLLLTPLIRVARAQQLTPRASDVKNKILRRVNSNVTVKLINGTELKGRITQTSENMFTLREDKTKYSRDISFAEVLQVKGGGGLSKGAKFGILTGILTGAVLIGVLVSLKRPAPFEHGVLR